MSAAEFLPSAVIEDVDNALALAPLAEKLAVLVQRTDDSKLVWLAEAYVPSLALYRIAKAGTKVNGQMAQLVEPMGAIFAARRKPTKGSEPLV